MSIRQRIVDATPRLHRPVLVAVDGVDGSGKTTFAASLAEAFREAGRTTIVVHLDHFLNNRLLRHRLGRNSPEGFFRDTYDLDAFRVRVLEPLSGQPVLPITLRVFDHVADAVVDEAPIHVPEDCVVIVEGMFLHRNELRDHWDVSVFLHVPFHISVRRMADRDGSDPDPESESQRRYVEGQRIYFARCNPTGHATFIVDNS